VVIFDGDCNFCRVWIRRWADTTGDTVEYLPYQAPVVAERFPELARPALEEAVHLVELDGTVRSGAEAVLRALAVGTRWPLWIYQHVPGAAPASEAAYRLVARNRRVFSWLTRLFWGADVEPPSYFLVRWLFLRGLGLIYLIAFLSLNSQILGLTGSRGIVPAEQTMRQAAENSAGPGWQRYLTEPTLCWLSTEDRFLKAQCLAGVALSLLVVVGVAPGPCLFLLWVLYLSVTIIGDVFLGFQWDNLLLETGLLAVFLGPIRLWPHLGRELPPSRVMWWLLRWLLFRLMFASGWVKLLSGDTAWHQLTALSFHYETQPLPTWVAWYAHQLPGWFQQVSCVIMFAIELVGPFFIWLPRRPRRLAFWSFVSLQLLILITGNYTFFNYLTLLLCLTLLDDAACVRFFPQFMQRHLREALARARSEPRRAWLFARRLAVGVAAPVILLLTTAEMLARFGVAISWPAPVVQLYRWAAPLRSLNTYGLFAVMTTSRPEIVLEGSSDGRTWRAYEFMDKPGDLKRRPRFVAPHQPRLDWQMWFAALGDIRRNPWLVNCAVRLLQGSPEVRALLREDPFPDRPPRYVQALVYDYHFTTPAERRQDGAWWRRELKGSYFPPISLSPEGRPRVKMPE
jgi:predicted DCC family thiol-disulfide oxidoreductase YuxK